MFEALQQEIRDLHALEGSARDPQGRIFLPLADAHLRAGQLDVAEELLVDGLARHPDFVAAHVLAARLREAQGNVDGAELAWAAARRLDPENAEVLFGLGRIMASRGEEIGVALVEKARAIDPTAGQVATAPAAAPEADPDADLISIADLAPDPVGLDEAEDLISIADLAPDPVLDPVTEPISDFAPDSAPAGPEQVDEDHEALAVDDDADGDVISVADLASDDDLPPAAEAEAEEEAGIPPISELAPSVTRAPVQRESNGNGNGERGVVTRTLAELLVQQGKHVQAVEMYEALVARHPDDGGLSARLAELREAAPGSAPDEEDVRHHPSAPEPAPEAPTPFAWTEEHEGEVAAESDSEPGVSTYFEGLLSWTPSPRPDEDA